MAIVPKVSNKIKVTVVSFNSGVLHVFACPLSRLEDVLCFFCAF